MKATNRKKLEKLQKEYNELHERIGYCYDPSTIAAINRRLDKINDKMDALLK